MKEERKRSVAKALSWRVIATLTTMGIVYMLTGELELMLGVGALDITLKLIFYYMHERAWNRITWGKKKA